MQVLRMPCWMVVTLALALMQASDLQAEGQGVRTAPGESVSVRLLDLELTDQDGSASRFKTDIIGDRVAVIIPFYTTCTTAFPILVYTFTRLQEMLGEQLGKEVVLVSVSVDPRTDIPVRLKAYARRQKARPGWVFLTGDRESLGQTLWGVGVLYSSNLDEHNHIPVILVGHSGGEWKRFHGFPSPDQVMQQVEKALASRRTGPAGKES